MVALERRGPLFAVGPVFLAAAGGLVALAMLLALGSCGGGPGSDADDFRCETDADCKDRFGDTFECHDGSCVDTEDPSRPCTKDGDCEEGYECRDGVCERACDPSCLGGECVDGECVCEGGCPEGEECQLGVCGLPCDPPCLHGYCLDGTCECLEECASDEECLDGRCVPSACDVHCPLNDECRRNEAGEWYCEPGELSVTIERPDVEKDGPWIPVRDMQDYGVSGNVLWLDEGGEPVVECEVGDVTVPATVDETTEQVIEGVTRSEWECGLDLSEEDGGDVEIRALAFADGREGDAAVTVLRDEDVPRINLGIELEESTDKVYTPQMITLVIVVEDHLATSSSEPDGKVESVEVLVTHEGSADGGEQLELFGELLSEDDCEGFGSAALKCDVAIELEPDVARENEIKDGEYVVYISATDAAGNTSEASGSFEVDRTPEILVEVSVDGEPAFDSGCPTENGPTVIRRDEIFHIELGLTRPEQVAEVDGEFVTPLVEIENAGLHDGVCDGHLVLEPREGDAVGTWRVELSAMDVCLPKDEKLYRIAVLIEDEWTFDPDHPKEIADNDCSNEGFAENDNLHCEPIEITRHMWPSKDLCAEHADDECVVLTPAVREGQSGDGSVYVAANHLTAEGIHNPKHKVVRLERQTGAEVATWTPAGHWVLNQVLVDGPVLGDFVAGTESEEDRIFIWVDFVLNDELRRVLGAVGFSGADAPYHRWIYPDLNAQHPPKVRGLPAIGHQGRLIVPMTELIEEFGEEHEEGRVALVDPNTGEQIDRSFLWHTFSDPVSVATNVGLHYEWTAVLDSLGMGGRVRCTPSDDPSCNSSPDQHEHPIPHVGGAAASDERYLAVFSDKETGYLCSYPFSVVDGDPICSKGAPLTAGPVYGNRNDGRMMVFVGMEGGLLAKGLNQEGGSFFASQAPLAGPVQSLSMDADENAYALIRPDADGVQRLETVGYDDESDSWVVHWTSHEFEPVHETVTPIISDGGTSACGRKIGVLYVAAGPKLHALITDAPPAKGWPNIRGPASRQASIR